MGYGRFCLGLNCFVVYWFGWYGFVWELGLVIEVVW